MASTTATAGTTAPDPANDAEVGNIAADRLRCIIEQVGGTEPLRVSDLIAAMVVEERWARVPDYPSYLVSSWGRVCREDTRKLLRLSETNGYLHVSNCRSGEIKSHRVNRLVAICFLGPEPFPGAQVAHNDGNRANNRLDNIRWATPTDNQWDRGRHGTRLRGAEVFGAKLNDDAVRGIKAAIASGERYPSVSSRYGVSISTISLIKRGRIWRHVS